MPNFVESNNTNRMTIGISYTSRTEVGESLTAKSMGSGDLLVFATPAMVALMENAAMMCVAGQLSEGQTTVGASIDCSHLRPTPLGAEAEATATLVEEDGRRLTFEIIAKDAKGEIGRAKHVRYIVDRERFMSKI